MCVWQSHAPAGTSKFTGVAGCEALASAKRGASAAAVAAMSSSRLLFMGASELVAAHAAVDGDDSAGDVARERRSEETGQVRDVLGLAIRAQRNVLSLLLRAPLRTVIAADLLAVDAPGGNGIHRDAVFSNLARQSLGP